MLVGNGLRGTVLADAILRTRAAREIRRATAAPASGFRRRSLAHVGAGQRDRLMRRRDQWRVDAFTALKAVPAVLPKRQKNRGPAHGVAIVEAEDRWVTKLSHGRTLG